MSAKNNRPSYGVYPAVAATQAATSLSIGVKARTVFTADMPTISCADLLSGVARFAASAAGTYSFRVWTKASLQTPGGTLNASKVQVDFFGSGTFTVDTAIGQITGTGTALDSLYFADEVTFTPSSSATTPKGYNATRTTTFNDNTAAVFSANDGATPAELQIPNLCREAALVFEFIDQSGKSKAMVFRGTPV